MITVEDFSELLGAVGFARTKSIWQKTIGTAWLEVDFVEKELLYPQAQGPVINERQACNFSATGNFVAFGYVHRLLGKGCKPEDIEFERGRAIMQRYL